MKTKIASLPTDDVKEMLREHYKNNLFDFANICLGFQDINETTHGEMIRVLESNSTRKLIVMPRGSLKSTLGVVAYSIWRLIKNPNERIMIDAAYFTNSKNFIREIRSHLESDKMIELFGDFRGTNWSEASLTIKQRTLALKEASISASGVGSSKVSQHFTIIISDDLNDEKNSNTHELRQKVIDHYKRNIAILEPNGTLCVVGTRYASDDVIGYIFTDELQIKDPGSS